MTESEMYELVGRKQAELDNLNIEYNRLLSVLNGIINGELIASRVSVDLEKRSWSIAEEEKG